MVPKDWLFVYFTVTFLSKCLSDYAGQHSAQHAAFLDEVGCNKNNTCEWLLPILQDRLLLRIHNFELYGSNENLRITYQVPLQSKKGTNRFNTDFVSVRIVLEYEWVSTGESKGFFKKEGRLITLFIQNKPFREDDKKTLLNICPGALFWGWSESVIKTYIEQIGDIGLDKAEVPVNPHFPIYGTAGYQNPSKANKVEKEYSDLNQNWIERSSKGAGKKINFLCADPNYKEKARQDFETLAIHLQEKYDTFLTTLFKTIK